MDRQFWAGIHRFVDSSGPAAPSGGPVGVSNRRAGREAWAPVMQQWRQFRQFRQFCTPGRPARPWRAPSLSLPCGGEAWGDLPSGRWSGPPTGAAGSSSALSKAGEVTHRVPRRGELGARVDARRPRPPHPLPALRRDHRGRLRPRPRRRLHRDAVGGRAGHGVVVGGGRAGLLWRKCSNCIFYFHFTQPGGMLGP